MCPFNGRQHEVIGSRVDTTVGVTVDWKWRQGRVQGTDAEIKENSNDWRQRANTTIGAR